MGDHKWPNFLDQNATDNWQADWISDFGSITFKIAIGVMVVLWLNFMMTP